MIEVRDLHKSFGDNQVLRGIDLNIEDGETLTILGRSGSGKTVLLKNIVGLMKPDKGWVSIDGVNISSASRRQKFALRRQMGFVFQSAALFDSMTVYQNLALPLAEARFPKDEIEDRVRRALEMVDMADTQNLFPAELSGGMKKRVGVARAIVAQPKYIFYDEPTTGLDPITADTICDLIKHLDQVLGTTSVVVSHDMHLATKVSDRIVLISQGEIAFNGNPEQAMNQGPDSPVSRFIQATKLLVP